MCYGNAAVTTDQSNKTGVWDSNFKAVYHLNDQAATTTVADSSANANNGVNAANTSSKSTSGKVGQALNYNGSSDNTATGVTQTNSFTWECWFKLTDWTTQAGSSNYSTLMAGVWGNSGALLLLWKDSGWLVEFAVDNAGGAIQSGTNSIAPGSWHHAAFTRTGNSGTYALYLDGVWKGQDGSGTNNTNTTISLGTRSDYTSQALNGLLDETRISNTARSADWIKTEYNNQSSPATFYSISAATTGSTTTNSWLITDQLGTPRMILDQTGSLSGMKRHDYLPFGEELFGGTDANSGPGGRKPSLGYGCNPSDPNCAPDRVRQQFTQKERDIETRLDYFDARYYTSIQGRFTSTDPIALTAERLSEPQQINPYCYARNNPLKYVDPTGEDTATTQIQEYEFTIDKRGKDRKGNEWVYQVRVTVKETTITRTDDEGRVTELSTAATATAENTAQATNLLSQDQLKTVGKVTEAIVEEAGNRGVAREVALAIATRETFLGSESRNVSFAFQDPKINPLQLTTGSGKQPTTDLQANVGLSIDHFIERSAGHSLVEGLQRYGPGVGNAGGAGYGRAVAGVANGIRGGITGSIRTTGFGQRYETRNTRSRP